MTQTDFFPTYRIPDKGTQCRALLDAMQRGERLTVAVALSRYGVYALSQRCGELRNKLHWPIKSKMVETEGGARVACYWLEAA